MPSLEASNLDIKKVACMCCFVLTMNCDFSNDITYENDVPALTEGMTKYVHREITFQIGEHVERIDERLDSQDSAIEALRQNSVTNARNWKNQTNHLGQQVAAVECNVNQRVDNLEKELTRRRGTSKEDVQGIVDRTINPVIEEQRNRLDAQEREINDLRKTSHMRCAQTQLTQPPTRLPQPTVQPHKKRPEHGSLQHPKPQPQRQLQHLPDRKEPYTQPKLPIRSTGSLTRDTALRDRPETLDVVLFKQYLAHKKLDLELDAVVPRLQAVCRTYLTCKASQFQGRKRHQLAQWRQHLIAQPTFLVSLQASIRGGSVRSASGAKRHQLGDWHRRLVDRPESLISLQAALRTALMCQSKGRKQHQLAQWHRYLKAQPAFLITLQSSIRGWTVRSACGGKRHQLGDWRRRLIDRPESLTSFQAALRTALMCQSKGKKQYQLAQWHRYLTTQPAFLISLQSSIRGWTVRSAYGGKRHQLGDWRRRLVDRPESLTSLQAALRTALMCQSKGRKQHQLAQWRQYLVAQSALIPLQTAIRGWLARSASGEKRHHMGDWRRCLVDRPNLLICLQAVLRTALTQDRFQRLRHTFVPLHLFHFSAVVQDTLMRNQIGQVTSLFLLLFPYEVRYVRIRAEANLWCFSIAFWSLNSYIQTLVAHTWSGICVWGLCHPTVAPLVGISRKPYFAATPSLRICGGFALILTLFWLILSSQTTVSDVPMMATDSTRFRRVVEIGLANSNR